MVTEVYVCVCLVCAVLPRELWLYGVANEAGTQELQAEIDALLSLLSLPLLLFQLS